MGGKGVVFWLDFFGILGRLFGTYGLLFFGGWWADVSEFCGFLFEELSEPPVNVERPTTSSQRSQSSKTQ